MPVPKCYNIVHNQLNEMHFEHMLRHAKLHVFQSRLTSI